MTVDVPDARDPDPLPAAAENALRAPAATRAATPRNGDFVRPVELEPLLAVAKRLRSESALRSACFGRLTFFEPAWDLMLHLLIAGESGVVVDVGEACRLVSIGSAAGIRWIGALAARGLIDAGVVSTMSETTPITLSARGRVTMANYLAALR